MNKYFFHNLKTVPFHSLDAYFLIYVCNLHILNYHERKRLDLVRNVYIFPYSEYITRDILHIFYHPGKFSCRLQCKMQNPRKLPIFGFSCRRFKPNNLDCFTI